MKSDEHSNQKVAFLTQTVEDLAKKAKLRQTPDVCVSKSERFASVGIFQNRITVGEHLLSMWQEGKFDEKDIEATLAHEVGHLMDFRRDSHSLSFRNLLVEGLWFGFGVAPLVIYVLFPSLTSFVLSALLAVGWGFSLPWIVRWVEVSMELEADRNAAVYLVAPQQLAKTLTKISSFGLPTKKLGFTARMAFQAGTLMHPSFKERVRYLQSLQAIEGMGDHEIVL